MSDDKFKVIKEIKVGTLDETMRDEWDRITLVDIKLRRLQEEQEEALDAFGDALKRKFGEHQREQHAVTQNLRVAEDGDVLLCNCECPPCQAILHGMTVTETVEQMYANNLIPAHEVNAARSSAKRLDAGLEMRKKMMN